MILSSGRFPTLELALAVLLLVPVSAFAWARAGDSADPSSLDSPVDTETIKIPVVEGKDIRFARISSSQGLSQVRVSDIVQDDQGFIWFGTWNLSGHPKPANEGHLKTGQRE